MGINFNTKGVLPQIGKYILENKEKAEIFTVKISEMRAKTYRIQKQSNQNK